ncbi:MAG: hemerythrin domain-containing protein [Tannerella sp.]|jgi:regulator of cell morphogenesis and NO signaling|nr:hemerythrin domain-containing protein [Tannerella sp.]
MGKVYFTEKMKLADIISANHNLILMLPRFGIPLGFGDKSVSNVCKQNKVSTDFFLLVCNVYTFDNYIPDNKNIISINMELLIPYLLASHNYYLKERLPHIAKHLHLIAERAGAKYESLLKNFFNEYKNEVSEHFKYEEERVFPYIESLKNNQPQKLYRIKDFKEAHSNIEDKLNDLIQIVFKYLPGNIEPYESIELVFDIMQLSSDLNKHALIEEKILVSYVKLLEKRL